MISLFSTATQDQSIFYLSMLFGNVGNVLEANANSSMLLGYMFKTLNTTALVLGAIMVVYTTVVGLLKTAQEGEFLGKQWNSLWVPLRMVMGIAALFPTASGYSALQVFLMWLILQGVGAADTLWTTVLSFISIAGSPYAGVAVPTSVDINANMQNLFQALTCEATAKKTYQDTYTASNRSTKKYYYCASGSGGAGRADPWCFSGKLNFNSWNSGTRCYPNDPNSQDPSITCPIGPNGSCGQLVIGNSTSASAGCRGTDYPSQLKCAAYTAQLQVMKPVVELLNSYADDFANFDHEYMTFFNNNDPAPSQYSSDMLQRYCDKQQLNSPSTCCVFKQPNSGTPIPTNCQINVGGKAPPKFPSFTYETQGTPANAGPVKNILLPCGLLAQRGNTGKCVEPTNKSNFIAINALLYKNVINEKLRAKMADLMSQASQNLKDWQKDAQEQGWLLAGGYFYKMAKSNDNNLEHVIPPFNVTVPAGLTSGQDPDNTMAGFRNNYNAAIMIVQALAQSSLDSGSATASNPALSQIGSSLNQTASGITDLFMSNISGGQAGQVATNPLSSAQAFGERLLISAQIIYVVYLAISAILLIISKLNFIAMGFGLTSNPAEGFISFLVYTIFAILFAFMIWAITFGGLLAIYTPLIPYIIFTFGAIGWFIATIEAMVAAPFIALGILSPGGQHEILGRADPALMIMLNLFLRPSLMIMGMMAGMLLAPVVITMINSGFKGVMTSLYSNPGLVELILFISIYAMMVITALNKCFSLIYMLPNGILKWIGGQEISHGEEAQLLSQVKGGMEAAAATTGKSAESTKGSIDAVVNDSVKDKKSKQKAKADAALSASKPKPPGGGGGAP